jgi:hypothetical protein
MKIRVKRDEEKTTVMNEEGKVLSVWWKKTIGDRDVAAILRKMYKNAEIIEE